MDLWPVYLVTVLYKVDATEEYITCKQHFQLHKNKKGEICRNRGEDCRIPRKISVFESSKKFAIDSIEAGWLVAKSTS